MTRLGLLTMTAGSSYLSSSLHFTSVAVNGIPQNIPISINCNIFYHIDTSFSLFRISECCFSHIFTCEDIDGSAQTEKTEKTRYWYWYQCNKQNNAWPPNWRYKSFLSYCRLAYSWEILTALKNISRILPLLIYSLCTIILMSVIYILFRVGRVHTIWIWHG